MSISFLGGVRTVTGSRFLVETPSARVLVDCGMFQGLRELRDRNWAPFPVSPLSLDAIVLTHAHLDHVGAVPIVVRDGFDRRITCTPDTAALAGIVLPDSGHLQEEDADHANRRGSSKHHPALPLYDEKDARHSLERFTPAPFRVPVEVADGVTVTLRPGGHILGSSTVELTAEGRTVLFSGDLGRPAHHPLLQAPDPAVDADVLVLESTYGDRRHEHQEESIDRLANTVRRTVGRGGTVVIPAFAVDRTEVLLAALATLRRADAIPDVPVHVDSPMALRALRVYRDALAGGAVDLRPELVGTDPFESLDLHEAPLAEDSKALTALQYPSIVISASGMASGGRVLHHLERRLPDHRSAIVLAGYQAAGTRGRTLLEGARQLKMYGSYVPVRAEIVDLTGLSQHADAGELVQWACASGRPAPTTFVVHGEEEASDALADTLTSRTGELTVVPALGERVLL